jgi:4-guanidinobutyraldehyde dehydrogenase / NAD-dependent aldehyde dehydrogenase
MTQAATLNDWQQLASNVQPKSKAFINGRYLPAASGKTFTSTSPIDGRTLAQVASCDAADVDQAVKAARAAFNNGTWSNIPPAERKKKLLRFADVIDAHRRELALLETLDVGKPIRFSYHNDLPGVVNTIRWYAEAIDKLYDEIAPTGNDALGLLTREPVGVVAAVIPWNFPLLIAAWKLAPALAAGNCVVLKPAEQSPLSAIRLAELAVEAGIPEGVFNVVPGLGESAGQALGRHPDVDLLTFTGSTQVGKLFMRYSGESNLKQVALECGGKSPNLVLDDVENLHEAATAAAQAILYNTGQVCVAPSRLLIAETIADEFLEKVANACKAFVAGNPLDPDTIYGSVVDQTQLDRILGYVESGQQEGAKLILGGNAVAPVKNGCYMEPTIFDHVNNTMKIAQEEIFGPVLSVIRFKDLAEAVSIANDTIYGLQASVWTQDINKAHQVAKALHAGTVSVNANGASDITIPVGGFKQSGFGRDRSLHAIEKYTQIKTTYIKLSNPFEA